jgi:hypothetical protein
MAERILTRAALLRALLARQLLLERSDLPLDAAIAQVGGLQTQYAPSGYVGLWTRLAAFRRDDLTDALGARTVVQATLMRVTIHIIARREFWSYAMGVRQARRDAALRTLPRVTGQTEDDLITRAGRIRAALADGPRTVKELGDLGAGFVGNLGLWVDLVRVPPSGTWARRRADRLALAEDWVGPCDVTETEGRTHVVRAYLRGFGPAAFGDIASWSGLPASVVKEAASNLALVHYRDEEGHELVDLPGAPLPDASTVAPVRFLPHWDATLLVHARRTGLLPEPFRSRVFSTRNPFSVGTYLVDGVVAGGWSLSDGRIRLDPYRDLDPAQRRAVEDERAALEAFHG